MAHKTLINGTAYEISGGRTLVNGTGYSIDKGKTLVGGTAYEVGFAPPVVYITYLRPSADVSVGFVLVPNGSSAGYLLINEESPDGSSTCLRHSFNSEDTSSFSESSTFKFSCVDAQFMLNKIMSAKLYVNIADVTIGEKGDSANVTNFRVEATVAVDGVTLGTRVLELLGAGLAGQYVDSCADITDILANKQLSSDYTVTLTLVCDNCEEKKTEGTSVKVYTENIRSISTAWIEVECV